MHRLFTTISQAMRNLTLHKLRVFLTILGLIFGVSSVIVMLAIAEGASLEAQRQIAELGATNVIIRSVKPIDEENPSKQQNNDSFIFKYGLTYKDFDRIVQTLPTVTGATPIREFRQSLRNRDKEIEGRVVGVNPDFFRLTNQKLAEGRFISDADLHFLANVVVIGSEVAEKLFPFGDPMDRSIRIGESHFYRIVGVAAPKASSAGTGSSLAAQDFKKDVYIPLTTDRARFGEVLTNEKQGSYTAEKIELTQVTVAVDAMENVKRTAEAVDSMLRQFHPKKDYEITVPLELLEKAEATKRIFNLVLGSIASISLLVGGIGIMNIMLATVSERTREIGIRRALGAKRRDIIEQFLIETAVMSGSGGIIGVALGLAFPPLVASVSGIPVVVSPWSPVVAFLIAVLTGIVFGVYPARRAALLDPVEALRAE
ncbi:ABC transporter permease [Aquisphaera insulae]|uniref:ABC transporter permease n=1 Tax=Aquisphaera insulae TaxID=2712864 RepID=UPI0013ED7269|nr:ABC transporter permease [Aquisphaera insulae]